MPTPALAHIRIDPAQGPVDHLLVEHSRRVGELAAAFATTFGPDWADLAGRWHDLGKFRVGFQRYIRGVNGIDAHLEGKWPTGSDKTHSAAGALHARRTFEERFGPRVGDALSRVMAYVIAGHHAGLDDWTTGLADRLLGSRAPDSQREYDEALLNCEQESPELLTLPESFTVQAVKGICVAKSENPLAWSVWIRMLFSALVDADFLDTEAFMQPDKATRRQGAWPITQYRDLLMHHLAEKAAQVEAEGRHDDPVMQARRTVLSQCIEKSALAPGVFTLTVPTGGGKTLSSLAFALKHAAANQQRRIIYAIPYTSIIEQTASIFKSIFGDEQVIEHHSQADAPVEKETPRSRLACENWDAPLIVTTNVQLFESLFASRTSQCRKLHRIANSVIVLDEAQLLPPEFLQPVLDALHVLVLHFGVTVLLCTATQPSLTDNERFDPRQALRGLPEPTPLIDHEALLYDQLRRVDINWPDDLNTPIAIEALAQEVARHDCVLTIVNTRNDAADLVQALDAATGERCLHLSAAMCGQHRADVIEEIRIRLRARRGNEDPRPLRVVSTQLVEAGVDIDFPVVYRALAGLDSIAQAAGRCNREGQLAGGTKGQVHVFVRDIPKTLHALRFGAQATRGVLASGADPLSPAAFRHYFPLYYASFPSRDQHQIVRELSEGRTDLKFQFRTAAQRFKLIDDQDQATVLIPYESPNAPSIRPLIEILKRGDAERWVLRKLQRYAIPVRTRLLRGLLSTQSVQEISSGLFWLVNELTYDRRQGLLSGQKPIEASVLVQ